jgi:TolB protein
MSRLVPLALLVMAALAAAAPVPIVKKNQWLISMDDDLYLFTEGDEKPTKLTDGKGRYKAPTWSPDGKRIAFCSSKSEHSQIYIMDADGKNVSQLTHSKQNHYAPNWSPDGQTIAFCRDARKDRICEICTLNVKDGKDLKVLSNSNEYEPVFSPDGKSIAVVAARKDEYAIYTMDADGKNMTRLVEQPVFSPAMVPAWSPDGKQLAVTLSVDNGYELHLVQPDGRGQKAVTKFGSHKIARCPSWSPNGKQLSFLLGDLSEDAKTPCSLWVMDATGDSQKQLLRLEGFALFNTAQWRPR